jgi:fumarylpyruvate hydrolase
MSFVFDPPPQASVAIVGSALRFPVRRIFCVGRNYADHVREMGNDPKSEPPIFFTKPADAVVENGASISYPLNTADLHHEVELVLALGEGGAAISEARALECIWGYGVGCDLTRRDRQAEAKKGGTPWDVAKAFDQSAPVGALTPVRGGAPLYAVRIWLAVNGVSKQEGDLAQMIWSPAEIIAALSLSWRLMPGDLIFTGTPAGVGPLNPGDRVECGVAGLTTLSFSIAPR